MGKWSELKAAEKARIIQFAIRQGVSDVNTIRDAYNIYAEGGGIHIDPSKKGTFTAAASKHGKSVQAFASQVLANKENYSPAMVKKANFARNAHKWKHEDGGYLGHMFTDGGSSNVPAPITTQGAMPVPSIDYTGSFLDSPLFRLSARLMEGARYAGTNNMNFGDFIFGISHKNPYYKTKHTIGNRTESLTSTPQDAYLLPTKLFNKAMLDSGYLKGKPGDYGTVTSAAVKLGNKLGKSIPVYQTYPDAITKDKLVHLGSDVELRKYPHWYLGELYDFFSGHPSKMLHPGHYASAYYMNPKNGLLYLKAWDLNDYSPSSSGDGGAASRYDNKSVLAATLLDKIGNPSVITTGFQPAFLPSTTEPMTEQVGIIGKYPEGNSSNDSLYRGVVDNILTPLLAKKGLYKHVVDDQYFFSPLEKEVVITPNKKTTGGPLYPFSFGNVPSVRYGIGGHLFQDGGEYGKFQEDVEYEILQEPTIKFIRGVVGAQRWARKHPETDQRGNNAEFWDRLMADTIQTIPDWEHKGEVASHKMAYTKDDGTYYIYPMVQMVDGKLVDYTNPKNKGVDAYMQARKNNNYIVTPNEAIASNFSKAYKQYEAFKGMAQFRDLANVMDDNVYHSNPKRIDTMYKMITDKGLDPVQAAGIIGSALVESRMNEYQHEVGNGQRGYGLMQWTNPTRRANLDAFKPKGIKTEFERQVAFMLEELQNPEMWVGGKKSLDAFMGAKTVEDAVKIFAEKYEHPKDAHMDRRVAVGELIHKTKAKK